MPPLNPTIEFHHPTFASFIPELLLQRLHANRLPLRKRAKGQRQRENTRHENHAQVHRQHRARPRLQPLLLLQSDQEQRREHHDGRGVEDAGQRGLADRQGCGLLGFAHRFDFLAILFALGFLVGGLDGEHVDSEPDLFAAHQEDVQRAGGCDCCEGHEATEDHARVWGEAFEARDYGVEAEGDGAGGTDGDKVVSYQGLGGEGGGLVGVGGVDGYVEGLVGDLPEERACCAEIGREHPGCDDEVGKYEA